MQVEIIELRRLLPSEGMFLYNPVANTVSQAVYLGDSDDGSDWVEITAEEASVKQPDIL